MKFSRMNKCNVVIDIDDKMQIHVSKLYEDNQTG